MNETEKSPAFQWYPKDDLSSMRVMLMSLEEEGAYRRAMNYCWLSGSIPADTRLLAQLIGKGCSIEVAETVKSMFVEVDGVLVHERLDKERDKQQSYRDKQSENGKRGGRPAKLKTQKKAKQNPEESQTEAKKSSPVSNLHSPSSSSFSSSISSSTPSPESSAENEKDKYSADAQGGFEKIEEKKITALKNTDVPLPWPGDGFAACWQKWKDYCTSEFRMDFKTADSELAQLYRLQKLAEGSESSAIAMIEQSIGNHWKGLFAISSKGDKSAEPNNIKIPIWRRSEFFERQVE